MSDDDIPEIEREILNSNDAPSVFANKVMSINELEKSSGTYQIPNSLNGYKNITFLSSVIKPKDQIFEADDEWNYDQLHTEISQVVRELYGDKGNN